MKKVLFLLFTILPAIVHALTIQQGTFYLDNSLTQYSQPKFVYGDDSKTYVVTMALEDGNIWKVTMPQQVTNMSKYFFSNTAMSEGTYDKSISTVKDEIASGSTPKENRTASRTDDVLAGYIFTPTASDSNNWWPGSWSVYGSGEGGDSGGSTVSGTEPSGTLPVLYITTATAQSSVTKDAYIAGTYYLDNKGSDSYASIGDKDNQLPLQIKGRGNYTWSSFDKKPYKIKLGEKQKMMGMKNGKHWALLAHPDDNYSYLKNTLGFEISRRVGLPWTPGQEPIELVWNGQYQGLYMLTETIRVGKSRVNIIEQSDNISYADSITGGWLVEIDNYSDSPQVYAGSMKITGHSPEVWSTAQNNYLQTQMNNLNTAVYGSSWNAVDNVLDLDAAAQFFLVQEIMDNEEAYNGSCFLYKDMDHDGEDVHKWMFGPVWDFGNCLTNDNYNMKHIQNSTKFSRHLMENLVNFPVFMNRVKEFWKEFKGNHYEGLDTFIGDFITQITDAAKNDGKCWPKYDHSDVSTSMNNVLDFLHRRISWLVDEWGEGVSGIEEVNATSSTKTDNAYYNLSGQRVATPQRGGIYIHGGHKMIMK